MPKGLPDGIEKTRAQYLISIEDYLNKDEKLPFAYSKADLSVLKKLEQAIIISDDEFIKVAKENDLPVEIFKKEQVKEKQPIGKFKNAN